MSNASDLFNRRDLLGGFGLGAAALPFLGVGPAEAGFTPRRGDTYDLNKPADLLEAFVKTAGKLDGGTTISYGRATIFARLENEKAAPVFGLEVIGAGRYEKIEGGWQRYSREIGFYTDLKTGDILERWYNPFIEREVEVIPIMNDPVNRKFVLNEQGQFPNVKVAEYGEYIAFTREVPLRYQSPLPVKDYRIYSQNDWYEAMEMFGTFCKRADLMDKSKSSVPSVGSWGRWGPWLPWMEMGQTAGFIVYHASAGELESAAEIPAKIRAGIERVDRKYFEAPKGMEGPDETSWTVFKEKIAERRAREGETKGR